MKAKIIVSESQFKKFKQKENREPIKRLGRDRYSIISMAAGNVQSMYAVVYTASAQKYSAQTDVWNCDSWVSVTKHEKERLLPYKYKVDCEVHVQY